MYLKLMSRLEAAVARVGVELLMTLIYLVRLQQLVLNIGLAFYVAKKPGVTIMQILYLFSNGFHLSVTAVSIIQDLFRHCF